MEIAREKCKAGKCHSWDMGVRLGPRASGKSANYGSSSPDTPPALREVSVREVANFSKVQCQSGIPPTMNAGAPLGYSRTGYRSAHVAMNLREAGKFASIRCVETASRAHAALKTEAAPRAKVGYFACCARATNVVLPPMYALGAFDGFESSGMALREAHGPLAARRFAA